MEKLDEKQEAANTRHRSTSDQDSTVVRHRDGAAVPSYKNHRVVDDKAGVITATKTTTGAVDEGQELCGMVGAHEQNTAHRARVVVADCRYGNTASRTHSGVGSTGSDASGFRKETSGKRQSIMGSSGRAGGGSDGKASRTVSSPRSRTCGSLPGE